MQFSYRKVYCTFLWITALRRIFLLNLCNGLTSIHSTFVNILNSCSHGRVFVRVRKMCSCLNAAEAASSLVLQVTKQHNEDCQKLLRLMGVPIIEVITNIYFWRRVGYSFCRAKGLILLLFWFFIFFWVSCTGVFIFNCVGSVLILYLTDKRWTKTSYNFFGCMVSLGSFRSWGTVCCALQIWKGKDLNFHDKLLHLGVFICPVKLLSRTKMLSLQFCCHHHKEFIPGEGFVISNFLPTVFVY